MNTAAQERLLNLMRVFRSLNPEVVALAEKELLAAAGAAGADCFASVAAVAREVVESYLSSPIKHGQALVLKEYYDYLEQASRRLLAAGELKPLPPTPSLVPGAGMALVPARYYNTYEWLQLTERANVPAPLAGAVAAAERRNEEVGTVLEPLFVLLQRVDFAQALAWELDLCGTEATTLDPEVARDLLRAWRREPQVPAAALRQALRWGEDERVFRHWPAVTREADRLLRRHWLRQWQQTAAASDQSARDLGRFAPFTDERKLLRWQREAIGQMGESIDFFCAQAEVLGGAPPADQEWRRAALFRELVWLHHTLPPLLLLADLTLGTPNGPFAFAMAVFGFTREAKRKWEARLYETCRRAIIMAFVNDLKAGRRPTATIQRLCLGDADFEALMLQELDALSQDFDSLKQRNVVAGRLAAIVASYHEQAALAEELARRYRRTMRTLHEDQLRRVLTPEQFAEVAALRPVLDDLLTIAAESRRFLALRCAEDRSLRELIAADSEYALTIHRVRARYLGVLVQAERN